MSSKNKNYQNTSPRKKLTLGELRNLCVQNADGKYICQWDDDDWYSEDRLQIQMEYIIKSNKAAWVLLCWIIFDSINKKSYLSSVRAWEGSIL
ncbi:MAG: glycosyltransferase family 2 protein [Tannerellaceae bacterium]|nr:glycosyltransferase family 2 protein [Tannerellaceae bacterium]